MSNEASSRVTDEQVAEVWPLIPDHLAVRLQLRFAQDREAMAKARTALERAEKAIDALLILVHQFVHQPLEKEIYDLKAVRAALAALPASENKGEGRRP